MVDEDIKKTDENEEIEEDEENSEEDKTSEEEDDFFIGDIGLTSARTENPVRSSKLEEFLDDGIDRWEERRERSPEEENYNKAVDERKDESHRDGESENDFYKENKKEELYSIDSKNKYNPKTDEKRMVFYDPRKEHKFDRVEVGPDGNKIIRNKKDNRSYSTIVDFK